MSTTRLSRLQWGALAAGLTLWVAACGPDGPPENRREASNISVMDLLRDGDPRFERAEGPRTFSFPEDHGPHPTFRTEWWYVTGNLDTQESGHRFGFQLTFFRSALSPAPSTRTSAWATNNLYMAHLALTDLDAAEFHARERFSREALGLAGARSGPFGVWLEDWSLTASPASGSDFLLVARDDTFALELELRTQKDTVLQGDRGLSRKGDEPGNASYYYSMTRLATRGTVSVDGASWPVTGLSWLDREWSTSSLDPALAGWDWLALQLDDGRDLMVYKLRLPDGSAHSASAGSLVEVDGSTRTLSASDFALQPVEWWTSGATGITYPVRFELEVFEGDGTDGLKLDVASLLEEQEHTGSFRYWEGAVAVAGRDMSIGLTGRGYVELTGYDDSSAAPPEVP